MKLGIGSYTYGWAVAERKLSAPALMDRATACGVRVVQVCDNLPPETYEPDAVERLAARASAAGVILELGTRGSRPEHVARFIGIARRLGSRILRLVIDDGDDHPAADEVARRLASIVEELDRADVTLAIENHDRFPAHALVEIIRKVGNLRVCVCLDTVNSFGALEGPEVVVETLGPHVVSLHLKDFVVTRFPHMQGFTVEGRPLGTGMLDVPWLLAKLESFGRDPNAIIEHWVPPESTMTATIEKEHRWAEQSVAAARQWIKD